MKNIVALTVVCGLLAATGVLGVGAYVHAGSLNGPVGKGVYVQGEAKTVTGIAPDENFFGSYDVSKDSSAAKVPESEVYMPGDSVMGSVALKNDSPRPVQLYLYAQSTTDDKFTNFWNNNGDRKKDYNTSAQSAALIENLDLKVDYTNTDGTTSTVYTGKMSGSGGMNTPNAIDLGEYEAGADGTLDFTVTVPTSLGNTAISGLPQKANTKIPHALSRQAAAPTA